MEISQLIKSNYLWIQTYRIEHHERLFTENNSSNKGRMKADIVGVRLSDNRQVVFLKMSGAPTDFLNVHTMGDTYKKVQERVDSLNSVLLNFLNYDVRYAKKILSKGSVSIIFFLIDYYFKIVDIPFFDFYVIGDRLTLRSIFLRGKDDYADEEEFSAVFPLSWEFLLGF